MTYSNAKDLRLLKNHLNCKKNNIEIDKKTRLELLYYEIYLYHHLFWTKRTDFISWMKDYIGNSITLEEFEDKFSALWSSTMKELSKMRLDLKELKNFNPNPKSDQFGTYFSSVFRMFEMLEDEIYTEQEVRDSIISILDQIEKRKLD